MIEQGTKAWLAMRGGCVGASRIIDVMAKSKDGEAATRKNYKAQLIAERLTGQAQESFTSDAMKRGTEIEPVARAMYEVKTGNFVDQVGFIIHPDIAYAGASPDGLIDSDGLVEIKCPNTATHIEYLKERKPPRNYMLQMQWQMECTGRKWCDWVSYDDRLPERLQMMIVRVERDQEMIDKIKVEVIKFLEEIDESIKQLDAIQ